MTEYELLRIITFLERVKGPYRELVPIAEEDASWNILLHLIKQNLTGSTVTISSLASIANIPFATANRRIHELIEAGHILKRAASKTGRSFVLAPSPELSSSFVQYAKSVKSLPACVPSSRTKRATISAAPISPHRSFRRRG
jgi:multiple sugar transport system substrate-binding protein